ncbi:MAG: O-antigen ligase family protein [Solirubrobacteraceae bacterium]
MALDSQSHVRLLLAGLLGLAAVVGVLAGVAPAYAVGLALASVFAVIVLADLALGVCVFTTVAFVEALPNVFGGLSAAKAIGGLLVLSWIAGSAYRRRGLDLASVHPALTVVLVLMVVWTAAGALWALQPGATLVAAQSWALNILLFPIVFSAIRTPRHLSRIYAVLAVGTLLSAVAGLLGIGGAATTEDAGRLVGAGINPNQLGGLLIIGTVFAVVLGARRGGPGLVRVLWLACACTCGLALALTLSRGALVGMAVCLLVAPVVVGPGRRGPVLAASGLVVVTVVLAILALVPTADSARLLGDTSGSGRTDIWQVGLRMVADNPVAGVGANNFPANNIRYLIQPGVIADDYYIVDVPKVPHNIYLQALAELGIIGLGLFLTIIGVSLSAGLRAARNFARDRERTAELYARALVIATVGFLAFEFFSSQMYSKALWLLLALGPATLAISSRGQRT